MERYTVPRRPKMEAMQTSLTYTSFPLKPQLVDVSFSSYLQPEQPKKVIQQQAVEEAEISIFDAERYFNEGQDQSKKSNNGGDVSNAPRFSSVSSVDGSYGRNYRTGSFNATPTASSEASWNSQAGLLSNPPGSIAISMRNLRLDGSKKKMMNRQSSGKWFFRRRCPCSGKKSVQVQEQCSEPKIAVHCSSNATIKQSSKIEDVVDTEKQRSPEKHFPAENISQRVVPSGRSFGDGGGGGFSFPILNPPPPPTAGKLSLPNIGKQMTSTTLTILQDPPRESLEVFQPFEERHVDMSLREDINHRSFNIRKSNDGGGDDGDIMSDASSDLFEIESFSTQSTMYPMFRRKDSLDDMSFDGRRFGRRSLDETTTIAPTECYEPSEASIDWSVTTAEGFSVSNFSISASEFQYIQSDHSKKVVAGKRRGNGGLLTSCRCEKAVNVAARPVKCVPGGGGGAPPQFPVESGKIQSAARLGAITIPITRSHSARMSRALATH